LQLLGRHVVQRPHDLVLAGECHGERGVIGPTIRKELNSNAPQKQVSR
jgi:hypothetical protein